MGETLKKARDDKPSRLKGMVVTTKIDENDVVQDPVFELKDYGGIGRTKF